MARQTCFGIHHCRSRHHVSGARDFQMGAWEYADGDSGTDHADDGTDADHTGLQGSAAAALGFSRGGRGTVRDYAGSGLSAGACVASGTGIGAGNPVGGLLSGRRFE